MADKPISMKVIPMQTIPTAGSQTPVGAKHGNIFGNLFDELKHLGPDLFAGIGMLGHDAGKMVLSGGGDTQFLTDLKDLGKGIVTSERDRWLPLMEGDFKKFWHQTEEDPLGLILDLSTVASLGGASAGKLAKAEIIAKGADAPDWAIQASGLKRHSAPVRAADDAVDSLVVEHAPVSIPDLGSKDGAIAKAQHEAAGRVVDDMGNVWEPARGDLLDANGDSKFQKELSINPVIRARQVLGLKVSNKVPTAGLIGSEVRANRLAKREGVIAHQNKVESGLSQSAVAHAALSDTERQAIGYANMVQQHRATGVGAAEAIEHVQGFYRDKLERLKDPKSDVKEIVAEAGEDPKLLSDAVTGKQNADELARQLAETNIRRRIENLNDPEIRALVAEPSEAMVNAMKVNHSLSREVTRVLYDTHKVGYRPLREGEKADGLTLHPKNDKLVRMSFDDTFKHQLMREARMMRDPQVSLRKRLTDEPVEPTGESVEAYEQWVKDWESKLDESLLDRVYIRPHMKGADVYKVAEGRGASTTTPSIARGKHNKGFNLSEAADMLEPEGVAIAFKQAMTYKYQVARLDVLKRFMRPWAEPLGVTPPKGHVVVEVSKIEPLLRDVRDFLANDAPVIFGEDSAIVEVTAKFDELARAALPPDGTHAVVMPERIWHDFKADFAETNKFIQKYYDKPLRFWKMATLSARPVWVTSNFVSQLFLLLATKGLVRGTAAYLQAWRMGGMKGGIFEELAPAAGAGGIYRAHIHEQQAVRAIDEPLVSAADPVRMAERLAEAAKDGSKSAVGRLKQGVDWVSEFNARLTDDIPRRAAMWADLKPQVDALMEHGMSRDEALTSLLSREDVVDRLIERTLSDLVDFRSLTRVEKNVFRRIVPFYAWTRGATSRAFRMLLDEPWKVWQYQQFGKWGHERQSEFFGGELSEYQRGLVPFLFGRELSTASLNPWQTGGDIAGMAKGVVSGDVQVGGANPGSQLSPLLKAPIEAMTNRDLFYGTPLQSSAQMLERKLHLRDAGDRRPTSMAAMTLMQLLRAFPQERYVEKALPVPGLPLSGSKLYEPSAIDQLVSYFLLPVKQTNLDVAHSRAAAERSGLQPPLY